jgi:hypothetical protein
LALRSWTRFGIEVAFPVGRFYVWD